MLLCFMAVRYSLWTAGKFYASWCILRLFGIVYGQLVNSMAIWYIMWLFGIFFLVLVLSTEINLATLIRPIESFLLMTFDDWDVEAWPAASLDRDSTSSAAAGWIFLIKQEKWRDPVEIIHFPSTSFQTAALLRWGEPRLWSLINHAVDCPARDS
jgi:hypothetical protein